MNLKKIGSALLASAFVLATPFTAFAALTYKGYYSFNSSGTNYKTKVISSDGGDFKICPSALVAKFYTLYEYDPDNPDEKVDTVIIGSGKCHTFKGVGKYDPAGNNPEFYVVTSTYQAYGTGVKVYD